MFLKVMLKYAFTTGCWCMFYLITFKADAAYGQCSTAGKGEKVKIYNLTSHINFDLPNETNLSSYQMNITYSWMVDVPENDTFDGFIYEFIDVDEQSFLNFNQQGNAANSSFQSAHDAPNFHFPFIFLPEDDPPSACDEYEGGNYWITDANGTYTNCSYPCKDQIDQDCDDITNPPVCAYLSSSQNYVPLPRYQRQVSFAANFGRKYQFSLLPYVGHDTRDSAKEDISVFSLFCRHHFIEHHNLSAVAVEDFCRQEQAIAGQQTASSPPANLSVSDVILNLNNNTVKVVITWRTPYDVRSNSNVSKFFIHSNKAPLEMDAKVDAKSWEEERKDPYYSTHLTFHDVTIERVLVLSVWPVISVKSQCILECSSHGELSKLTVPIAAYLPCNASSDQLSYCSVNASTCQPLLDKETYLANCTCPVGYAGNGINSELDGGTGCEDYNPCEDESVSPCASNAICIDAPPPSLGVMSCTCGSDYYGDGLASGSGCIFIPVIVVIALVCFGFLLAVIVVTIKLRRRLKNKRLLESTFSRFVVGKSGNYSGPLAVSTAYFGPCEELVQQQPVFGSKYELDRSAITTQEIIGRGNFGVVHKATLATEEGTKVVAVKSLTGIYTSNYRDDFLAEIALLINIGSHENILSVEGVCTAIPSDGGAENVSPLLVTEFMTYGDLLHFLWNSRDASMRRKDPIYDFTEIGLYKIGCQVAKAMHFLSQSRIIHGDVAARNVLVGENLKVKISDFGLANDVYRYGLIKGATERRVPFKWISPERMMGGKTPITWKSDVWSFGILLYEMVTLGAAPYTAMDPVTIFYKIQSGYRISQPTSCSDYLYAIMKSCWAWHSYSRPGFDELERKLNEPLRAKDAENKDRLHSRIMVADEINTSAYDLDIGRRDSIEFPADEQTRAVNGNAVVSDTPAENGYVTATERPLEVFSDETSESHGNVDGGSWHLWSGDIPVSVGESVNGVVAVQDPAMV